MKKIIIALGITALITVGCSTKEAVEIKENIETTPETVQVDSSTDEQCNYNGEGDVIEGQTAEKEDGQEEPTQGEENTSTSKDNSNDEESVTNSETPKLRELSQEELQIIQPNEVGEIMVIMYHSIQDREGYMVRSIDNFRADLERLYQENYRPISMADYIDGNIDIPAGTTPYVLTFDDGHKTNFQFLESTLDQEEPTIDPDCAVGILMEFAQKYDDFNLKGIFYLNGGKPFGNDGFSEYKIKKLIELGLEVGNHTSTHQELGVSSAQVIQKEIGGNIIAINKIIPDVEINSLALPNGNKSKTPDFQKVYKGEYDGITYENVIVLNVGWKPDYPIYHNKCNPKMLNRVQSGDEDFQLGYWMDNYLNVPHKRYISDGNPTTITFKKGNEKYIESEKIGDKGIVIYEVKE